MKLTRLLPAAIAILVGLQTALLSGCDDNTSTIGSSLITDQSEIIIDSTFTIEGRSVDNNIIKARTLTQLLGSIDARGFGKLSSDYVTQLMPSTEIDTSGVTIDDLDSLRLILRFYGDGMTGDSLVPMGLNVYPLERQLPENITSEFDPTGYYNPSSPMASSVYTGNTLYSDSLETFHIHVISVKMPLQMGRDLYTMYLREPEVFQSPELFAQKFPGIYVANSFGSGRVTNIFNTRLALYYRSHQKYTNDLNEERDTVYNYGRIIAASTPEVITNNNINFTIDPALRRMADAGTPLLVAPLGLDVEMMMPARDIIRSFRSHIDKGAMGVVNSLSMFIPVEAISNTYGIEPPEHVLLILAKDRDNFFADNKLPDNVTSILATYSKTAGGYTFSGLRPYIMDLLSRGEGNITDDDCRFLITPVGVQTEQVTINYTTRTVVTDVAPYVDGPAMAKILLDKAKITFTYSTETVKF